MKLITIFNFLFNISLIVYVLYKIKPFYFEIEKTFWTEKPTYLILWVKKSENHYRSVFSIPLCDTKKAYKEDTIANKKKK